MAPAVDSNPPARAWPGSGADSGPLPAAVCRTLGVPLRAIEGNKGPGMLIHLEIMRITLDYI